MQKKMARFDDVADRLKSAISNVEKKEEAKAKHEENIIQEEIVRRRMQEERRSQGKARIKYHSGRNSQKNDARRVEDLGNEVTDEV